MGLVGEGDAGEVGGWVVCAVGHQSLAWIKAAEWCRWEVSMSYIESTVGDR
jgi:hypothetical protein